MIITPLIAPILLWGAVILLGGLGGAGVVAAAGAFKDPKKNKLGILGMQGAGKTRFLSFLRNIPFRDGTTSRSEYEEFKYQISNGKKIIIKSGIDIGGGNTYRVDYNKIIDESDVLLYFFDIDKYLKNVRDNDEEYYKRSCNSRFEHIFSKVKVNKEEYEKLKRDHQKEEDKSLKKRIKEKIEDLKPKPILVIATHKDKYGSSEIEMGKEFDKLVQNKIYKEMLNDVQYVNLTNPSETQRLVNKIFNNK